MSITPQIRFGVTGAKQLAASISILALALFASPSAIQAQDLRIAVGTAITSADPHFHNQISNSAAAAQIFDALVLLDEKVQPTPGLAVSWRALDDTNWEFKLRTGVKFHDGSDFTADDVVASLKRVPNVPNSPNSFNAYVRSITDITVIDPLTIRFRTAQPVPLLPVDLANIAIVSSKNAASTTADFNNGKATIGTGPFKFVEFVPSDRLVLQRNESYWAGRSDWANVSIKMMSSAASRTAALLAGDVDLVDQVPIADLDRLKSNSAVRIERAVSTTVMYLHLDHSRSQTPFAKDAAGGPLAKNPLQDRRVREALSKAINRSALIERVLDGQAAAAGALMAPELYKAFSAFSPEKFDLDGARKLLADAGYPNGFGLTLHAPNDRYTQGSAIVEAIASMFNRAGVKAEVATMPWATYVSQASAPNYAFSTMLLGWPSQMVEPIDVLRGALATPNPQIGFGAGNRGRYSNTAMDDLLQKAISTVDERKREELLVEATKLVVNDYGVIPLYYPLNIWATRSNVKFSARSDGFTMAHSARASR